jgi:membrane fusion protein, multidrug efflux system
MLVLAGVHTVYAGEHVKPVKPLFDGQDNIDGAAGPVAR